jgi:hypothetical protein
MSTQPTVRRLHNDLTQMHQAQASEKKAQASVKTDGAKQKAALKSLQSQEQSILDSFANPQTPPTAQDEMAALQKMFGLGQKEVQTKDRFDAQIKKDQSNVKKDAAAVKRDRQQALKDLKPAEFHLSLKDTNAARKQLGLKALSKPVRAPAADPHHVTPTMRRLATDARATAMSMGGFHSEGLCATGVSRTIARAMGITVTGNGNQIDNNLPRSKFKQIHIPLSEALKIPGLVLTWEHTSTALGQKFGHTAITLGDGKESASDFVEFDTLAAAQSRTGLKIFMPTV